MIFPFIGIASINGKIGWQNLGSLYHGAGDGVSIGINIHGLKVTRREMRGHILGYLDGGHIPFLSHEGGYNWMLDLDAAKEFFGDEGFSKADWAHGKVLFEQETEFFGEEGKSSARTVFSIHFMKDEIEQLRSQRIFLSHKSANKPFVREIARVLATLGFEPWLDEDAMAAGANLERALLQGMKDSCAAVFFVTPEYEDKNYLATEIDYAIAEKRAKDDGFAIVTMLLPGSEDKTGTVPELLRPYVWKEPSSDLEVLNEILKALPIRQGGIVWK